MNLLLHPSLLDLAERQRRIDKALRAGNLSVEDGRHLTSNYAQQYKDHFGNQAVSFLNPGAVDLTAYDDDDPDVIWFTVTTLDEDRDGDIVVPLGRQGVNYEANPVWFFGHQEWKIPIGTSRSKSGDRIMVIGEESRIRQGCRFDRVDPDADFIFGKYKRGMLNSTSIAFVPIQARKRDEWVAKAHHHEDSGMGGWIWEIWDHTETSGVGVASNPYANAIERDLRGALRDSLDQERKFISPRLQKALIPYCAETKGCWNGWCPCPQTKANKLSKYSKVGDKVDIAVSSTRHAIGHRLGDECEVIEVIDDPGFSHIKFKLRTTKGRVIERIVGKSNGATVAKQLVSKLVVKGPRTGKPGPDPKVGKRKPTVAERGAERETSKKSIRKSPSIHKDLDTQYDQGYTAAWDGRPLSTNPYKNDTDPKGKEMSEDWKSGWRDGAKERLTGRKSLGSRLSGRKSVRKGTGKGRDAIGIGAFKYETRDGKKGTVDVEVKINVDDDGRIDGYLQPSIQDVARLVGERLVGITPPSTQQIRVKKSHSCGCPSCKANKPCPCGKSKAALSETSGTTGGNIVPPKLANICPFCGEDGCDGSCAVKSVTKDIGSTALIRKLPNGKWHVDSFEFDGQSLGDRDFASESDARRWIKANAPGASIRVQSKSLQRRESSDYTGSKNELARR